MSMRVILGSIKHADIDYDLIHDGDRIAVGVSGGKDSLVLLAALALYRKFSKKNYTIVGLNIGMGFPKMNFAEIRDYCKKAEIEFHIVQSKPLIYEVLKLNKDENGRLPCSICSKMKKAAINKAAKKYHCNIVAFAHHSDDAIETLVMNMTHGGRIATFAPKMILSRENITFIRPLVYCAEKEIAKTAIELKLPVCDSTCPNNKHTEREAIKQLLKKYYHLYPESRQNFLNMLSNQQHLALWDKINSNDADWSLNEVAKDAEHHTKKQGQAVLTNLNKYGQVNAALTYNYYDEEYILTAIFVTEAARHQGIGSKLVKQFLALPGQVFVCEVYSYQAPDFFIQNGFQEISKWKIGKDKIKYVFIKHNKKM